MTATLHDGFGGFLVLFAIAALAHEPWRWLGFILGRSVQADSDFFLWVRCVATALVAGLVTKLVVFPAGMLGAVPAWIRAVALGVGFGVFWFGRFNMAFGVASGALLLAALTSAFM